MHIFHTFDKVLGRHDLAGLTLGASLIEWVEGTVTVVVALGFTTGLIFSVL